MIHVTTDIVKNLKKYPKRMTSDIRIGDIIRVPVTRHYEHHAKVIGINIQTGMLTAVDIDDNTQEYKIHKSAVTPINEM